MIPGQGTYLGYGFNPVAVSTGGTGGDENFILEKPSGKLELGPEAGRILISGETAYSVAI